MRLPILGAQDRPAARGAIPADYKVALVYPPFGPSGLPSLGLALLSAGLKARDIPCRTFYWNIEMIAELPGESLEEKLSLYQSLGSRPLMPFNEWTFAGLVHGEALRDRERGTRALLSRALGAFYAKREHGQRMEREVLSMRDRASDLVDAMADRLAPYAVVGINTTFYQNMPALALARRIKDRSPGTTVVFGGANCDGEMGRALLERFGAVDVVFSGEVDHAFPDFVARLARGEDTRETPGMLRRDRDGAIVAGPPASPLVDLDGLPLPDFDDFIEGRRRVGLDRILELTLALESSRGCWWGARQHCTFCGLNANGMAYRQKKDERFRWELERMADRYGARFVFMADNILSMGYYDGFLGWVASESEKKTQFFYEIKANVNRKQVARLADAGVTAVQPGIESFSSSILALMRKGTTGVQNIAFLKYAREHGIYTAYNILVGFPGEDEAEYDRLAGELPKLFHLRPPTGMPEVEFHRFSPYHQDPDRFGLKLRPSPRYDHLYPFAEDEIAKIAYVFERTDAADLPPRRYLGRFFAQLERWNEHYRDDDCLLTWDADGMDILIDDRRPDFPRRRYRLRNHAAQIFRATDFPKPLKVLRKDAEQQRPDDGTLNLLAILFASPTAHEETLIDLDRAAFIDDPMTSLRPMIDAGILYVEDERILALPVHRSYRTTEGGWMRTGV